MKAPVQPSIYRNQSAKLNALYQQARATRRRPAEVTDPRAARPYHPSTHKP